MGRLLEARGNPLFSLEALLRFALVRCPRAVMSGGKTVLPGEGVKNSGADGTNKPVYVNFHLHRLVSLIFMYLMLQVLGLLWAFLLNAGFILVLDLSGALLEPGLLGGVAGVPAGLATFYVTYCIFRVFINFGKHIGVMSWQSLDDFPAARRAVARAAARRPGLLGLCFLPQAAAAAALLLAPPVCDVQGRWQAWWAVQAACEQTPLKYLTAGYERPRSVATKMLFFGLVQFTQVLLHQFPDWRGPLGGGGRGGRRCRALHGTLVALLFATAPWLVRWLGFHAGYDLLGVGALVDATWYGRALLLGWTLWAAGLAHALARPGPGARPPLTDDRTLAEIFVNLKLSFLAGTSLLFLRDAVHPRLGFLAAQQEWAAATIALPIVYALGAAAVGVAGRATWGLALVGGAASLLLALGAVRLSGVGGPGTLTLCWLHVFAKAVELLGGDELGIFGDAEEDNLFQDAPTLGRFGRGGGGSTGSLPASSSAAAAAVARSPLLPRAPNAAAAAAKDAGGNGARAAGVAITGAPLEQEYFFNRSHRILHAQDTPIGIARKTVSAKKAMQIREKLLGRQDSLSSLGSTGTDKSGKENGWVLDRSRMSLANDRVFQFMDKPPPPRRMQSMPNLQQASGCGATECLECKEAKVTSVKNKRRSRTELGGSLSKLLQSNNGFGGGFLNNDFMEDSSSPPMEAGSFLEATELKTIKKAVSDTCLMIKETISGQLPELRRVHSGFGVAEEAKKKDGSNFSELIYKVWVYFSLAVLATYVGTVACFQALAAYQKHRAWFPQMVKFEAPADASGPLVFQHALVSRLSLHRAGPPQDLLYPRYGLCGHRWAGLSLVDYALLSELAYFDPKHQDLGAALDLLFPPERGAMGGGLWSAGGGGHTAHDGAPLFELRLPPQEFLRHGDANFLEFYSASLNLSVVSVKGTDIGRISDFVEDIKLYTEPVVFMILSSVFPTVRMWSDNTASYMVDWLHETQVLFGLLKKKEYYHQVTEYVRSLKGRQVVLTGHSLGGGLARIAGALEGAPSVTFSPPGLGQNFRKFRPQTGPGGLTRGDLYHGSVAVVPENDPVARVDTQVGNIQHIMCKSESLALTNACHMLEGTLCELLAHCGDHRGRFTRCEYEYNIGSLVPFFWGFIDDYIFWLLPGVGLLFVFGALAIIPEI